ncbi:MAG: hypothetical protein HC836_12565 [Richelia sp. RM2_1_2]|nr:hypothetical protein [Richelia sp. RM2_1_2]
MDHDKIAADAAKFQINRELVILYKKFFTIIEDISNDYDNALDFLEYELPESHKDTINKIDFLNEKKWKYMRKKILDAGNEAKRQINKQLNQLEFKFKEDSYEEV